MVSFLAIIENSNLGPLVRPIAEATDGGWRTLPPWSSELLVANEINKTNCIYSGSPVQVEHKGGKTSISPVVEVLNILRPGNTAWAKNSIVERGVPLGFMPASKFYVLLEDQNIVGPFSPLPAAVEDGQVRIYGDPSDAKFGVHSANANALREIEFDGHRRLIFSPAAFQTKWKETITWTSDVRDSVIVPVNFELRFVSPFDEKTQEGGDTDAETSTANESLIDIPKVESRKSFSLSEFSEIYGWRESRTRYQGDRDGFRELAKGLGISSSLLNQIHCAFLSDQIPLVCGRSALFILEAYSGLVASHRDIVIVTKPSDSVLGDILGYVDQSNSVCSPCPYGLMDLARVASKSDKLFLVVITGINRAFCDGILMPLQHIKSGRTGAIPIGSDRSGNPMLLRIPENLLIAATATQQPPCLPLSNDIVQRSPLILTDLWQGAATLPKTDLPTAEFSLGEWRKLKEQCEPSGLEELNQLCKQARTLLGKDFSLGSKTLATRFYSAAITVDEARALSSVFLSCFLAESMSAGREGISAMLTETDIENSDELADRVLLELREVL